MKRVPHSDTVLSSVSVRFIWVPSRYLYYFLVGGVNPSTIIYHVRYANPEVFSFKTIQIKIMIWSHRWYIWQKNVEIGQSSFFTQENFVFHEKSLKWTVRWFWLWLIRKLDSAMFIGSASFEWNTEQILWNTYCHDI